MHIHRHAYTHVFTCAYTQSFPTVDAQVYGVQMFMDVRKRVSLNEVGARDVYTHECAL